MLFLLGIIFIIIGCLLFTYYHLKANEEDLDRPSFFNSKARTVFLIFIAIIFFVAGEYLIFKTGYYNYLWFVPILYFIGYYFALTEWGQTLIISKVFRHYLILKNPKVGLDHKEQLITPVGFLLVKAGMEKSYVDKAREYLKGRIESGIIKDVRDLPQEAWTIFHSTGKKEIKELNPENRLSQSHIDYLYEKIIENKTNNGLRERLSHLFWSVEVQLERLSKNFAFVSIPRPDFTNEEINLIDADVSDAKTGVKEGEKVIAIFGNISLQAAKKFGWVEDGNEYLILVALEFSRRYPEHRFSKETRKKYKYTKQQIFNYAQNWEKLDIKQN